MSSFEPGQALVPAGFVPDATRSSERGFESLEPPPDAERRGSEEEPETPRDADQIWLLGYAAGRDAAREELPCREADALVRAAQALSGAAAELQELRRDYLATERRALVELALAIAERILARELSADVDALAAVVERSLAALAEEGPVRVLLCDADHETVRAGASSRIEALRAENGVELEAAADLAPGEVRIQAGCAEVDGRLEALLGLVREGLEDCLSQNGDAP